MIYFQSFNKCFQNPDHYWMIKNHFFSNQLFPKRDWLKVSINQFLCDFDLFSIIFKQSLKVWPRLGSPQWWHRGVAFSSILMSDLFPSLFYIPIGYTLILLTNNFPWKIGTFPAAGKNGRKLLHSKMRENVNEEPHNWQPERSLDAFKIGLNTLEKYLAAPRGM